MPKGVASIHLRHYLVENARVVELRGLRIGSNMGEHLLPVFQLGDHSSLLGELRLQVDKPPKVSVCMLDPEHSTPHPRSAGGGRESRHLEGSANDSVVVHQENIPSAKLLGELLHSAGCRHHGCRG